MSEMRAEYREDDPGPDRYTQLVRDGIEAMEASPHFREGDKLLAGVDCDGEQHGGFGARGFEGHADLFVSLIDHAKAVIQSTGVARMVYEKQPDGSFVVRITYSRSHTGKDAAAAMARKFLRAR